MLAGTSLGDDAFFTHAFAEEGLAEGVVDFVSASVVEILAFEVDFRTGSVSSVKGETAKRLEKIREKQMTVVIN